MELGDFTTHISETFTKSENKQLKDAWTKYKGKWGKMLIIVNILITSKQRIFKS